MRSLKYLFLGNIFILFLFSCQTEETTKVDPEKEKLFQDVQSLRLESADKDSSLNQVLKYFNDIESNLEEIKKREGLISMASNNKAEMTNDKKSRIIEDIQMINALLAKNKAKISELRGLLKNKGLEMEELNKMIERLNADVTTKNGEIAVLKDELSNLKISYELLSMENLEKSELISIQKQELNTAFYCFGTSKELRTKGVLTKEGGFIGLGKSDKVSETINQEYFTKINVTETKQIDVFAKEAKLITTHPAGSYEWQGSANKKDRLIIKDIAKFWSVSKYLVIVVEQ